VFDDYMRMEADAPGKLALIEFMRDYYDNDIDQLNKQWKTHLENFEALSQLNWLGPKSFFGVPEGGASVNDFDLKKMFAGMFKGLFFALWDKSKLLTAHQAELKEKFSGVAAEQFYKTVHDIIREHAPNHLILGDQQLVISGSKSAAKAAAKYSDVYSVNPFPTNFWANAFAQTLLLLTSGGYTEGLISTGFASDLVSDVLQLIGDKPVWVEFGVVGDDTKHGNDTPGNFSVLPSQKDRSDYLESLYDLYLQSSQIVGIQYYAWADQPVIFENGRIHENNQFGLHASDGSPYEIFSERYKELNTWWLTRLRGSDQEGPQTLEPAIMASGHSTGSIKHLENMRSTLEWKDWVLSAWVKQDLYSKVKSLEIQINKMRALIFPGAEGFKLAQPLYRLGALHTVRDIDNIEKMLEIDPFVEVDSLSYEINIAPELDLAVTQGDEEITTARTEQGPITFTANVLDFNEDDVQDYTWSINGELIDNNQDVLALLPEQLNEGDNKVSVTVSDDGSPSLSQSQELNLVLKPAPRADGSNDGSNGGSMQEVMVLFLLFCFCRRAFIRRNRLSYVGRLTS